LVFAQTQTELHVFLNSLARAGAYFYEMMRVVQAAGACTTAVIAPELDTAANGCAHPPSVTRVPSSLKEGVGKRLRQLCASESERGVSTGRGLSEGSRAGLPVERSALGAHRGRLIYWASPPAFIGGEPAVNDGGVFSFDVLDSLLRRALQAFPGLTSATVTASRPSCGPRPVTELRAALALRA